jgi:hypothetical protein
VWQGVGAAVAVDARRQIGPTDRDGRGMVEAQRRPGQRDFYRRFVLAVADQRVGKSVGPFVHGPANRNA